MIRLGFKVYKVFIRKVVEPLGHHIGRMYFHGVGVSYGEKAKIFGIPTISMVKGSFIGIGDNVVLRSLSKGNAIGVNHEVVLRTQTKNARISIGNNFKMSGGSICASNNIKIGDNVMLGANVVIADNDFHGIGIEDRNKSAELLPSKPVVIEDGVWIGADVYICKGVTIGENSVIGSKSVVTKSVSQNNIVAGVPAKIIGNV